MEIRSKEIMRMLRGRYQAQVISNMSWLQTRQSHYYLCEMRGMDITMNNNEKLVIDIIKTLVSKKYKNSVSLDSRLREDLGLDSMKLISLAMNLEEKAGIDLMSAGDEVDIVNINTLRDVVYLIEQVS